MESFGVVLFHTSSAALRAEKILIKTGLQTRLIPTPRQFSSDCGIALRFDADQTARVRELLKTASVEFADIHMM